MLQNRIKKNFSQLPNEVIEDKNLSSTAKALFWYLASRPDGWVFVNNNIKDVLGVKDDKTIAKYLKELIDTGWIEKDKLRDSSGRLTGNNDYIINEYPFANRIGKKPLFGENHRITKKTELGKNPHLNNNKYINNTNIYKQTLENELEEAKKFQPSVSNRNHKSEVKIQILNLNLPKNVGREMWEAFVNHRLEKSKKWSVRGAEMLLKKLEGFDERQRERLLEESIIRGWDSVYEPQTQTTKQRNTKVGTKDSEYILNELKKYNLGLSDVVVGKNTPLINGKEIDVARDSMGRYFLKFKGEE